MTIVNQEIEDFKKVLEKEYGQVNINLEDGSYTEIEEEILDQFKAASEPVGRQGHEPKV